MPVASSAYELDAHTQPDGSRVCRETYTLTTGRVLHRVYRMPPGWGDTEAQARLAAGVAEIDESLAEQEAEALLGGS